MVLPRDLVTGQGLTWIGPRLPPPEDDVVQAGDRGVFLDYEGDAEHYVVEFENAVFCCAADDVHPDPRPPVPVARRHNATQMAAANVLDPVVAATLQNRD